MITTDVTVIGLGAMGRALAAALLAAGHTTTVWNRTPGRGPTGARPATSPGQAVAASPLTVVCLLDPDATSSVLAGLDDELAGRIVVDLTNTTPQRARQRAADLGARGAAHVDGAVLAVPPMIGGPDAVLLTSGDEVAFDRAAPVLSAVGHPRFLGPDPGLAALYDAALLSGMYGMYAGALHAFALLRRAGSTAADLTPLLQPWLAAMLDGLPETAAAVDAGPAGPATSPLAMQSAGFANLMGTADELGVPTALLAPVGDLLVRAVAAGHGDRDVDVLVEQLTGDRPTPAGPG